MAWARGRLQGFLLAAALGALALAALRVARVRPLDVAGAPPDDGYVRVPAVVHVHTSLSDGGGTPAEVIAAAREAGIGVLGITDHNNADARTVEGRHDGVLVLVGAELSTPSGHVLGVGFDRDPAFRFAGDVQDAIDDIRHLGGVAFAAHPLSPRADLRFTALGLPGAFGLELWNGDSDARRAWPRLLLTAAAYRLNPEHALATAMQPMDEALATWDRLLAGRDVPGLAGTDAHGRLALTRWVSVRFPSYRALFRLARNYLLLREPLGADAARDRTAVLDALRAGRFYIGVDALAPAGGFSFALEDAAGRRYTMGDHAPATEPLVARAGGRVPAGTRIVLKRDGAPVGESGGSLEQKIEGAGVYRVEAWLPGWRLPWVVTNPVYVFGPEALAARRRRAEAAQPPPAVATRPLTFSASPPFAAEHDPASRMDGPVESTARREDGSAAAYRLPFALAAPDASQPFTWCALVNREARDLSGWSGLSLRVRADGEYRFWVQLRDSNPASADGGLEWWMASGRAEKDWADVWLPFERFRTLNPRSDGRLDLDRVRALVFVVDHATVKPGTRGVIRIADLALYR